MKWRVYKLEVERLSDQVQACSEELDIHRRALRNWRRQTFGTAEALAWSFALGTTWGISRRAAGSKSRTRRAGIATANVSWLAWRMATSKAR